MWSRRRIDIGWLDLMMALRYCFGSRDRAQKQLDKSGPGPSTALACLSVRSGFDSLLSHCRFPVGSEILMSAITIADMADIVRHHGYVPVPVDLDPATMFIHPAELDSYFTDKSRALVVAHLFGSTRPIDTIIDYCHSRAIMVIEDAAQAFDGDRWWGHPESDVVMFSFGPIKTATALGGGLMIVRDGPLLAAMRSQLSSLPIQSRAEYLLRVGLYSVLKIISSPIAFGLFFRACRLLRKKPTAILNSAVRNIPDGSFFDYLRRQPSAPLMRMMSRRIDRFNLDAQNRRSQLGRLVQRELGSVCTESCGDSPAEQLPVVFSFASPQHTWWALPISVGDIDTVSRRLSEAGFDAAVAGSLRPIEGLGWKSDRKPDRAIEAHRRMLFLPLYPEMPDREVLRMCRVLQPILAANPKEV